MVVTYFDSFVKMLSAKTPALFRRCSKEVFATLHLVGLLRKNKSARNNENRAVKPGSCFA